MLISLKVANLMLVTPAGSAPKDTKSVKPPATKKARPGNGGRYVEPFSRKSMTNDIASM